MRRRKQHGVPRLRRAQGRRGLPSQVCGQRGLRAGEAGLHACGGLQGIQLERRGHVGDAQAAREQTRPREQQRCRPLLRTRAQGPAKGAALRARLAPLQRPLQGWPASPFLGAAAGLAPARVADRARLPLLLLSGREAGLGHAHRLPGVAVRLAARAHRAGRGRGGRARCVGHECVRSDPPTPGGRRRSSRPAPTALASAQPLRQPSADRLSTQRLLPPRRRRRRRLGGQLPLRRPSSARAGRGARVGPPLLLARPCAGADLRLPRRQLRRVARPRGGVATPFLGRAPPPPPKARRRRERLCRRRHCAAAAGRAVEHAAR
mmetsp:Transcript_11508/g.36744  ORF Transcript_11508/g.36744 Transcript_11508/m.36744 type:complete len:320 (-) Transcript_11508:71-1030(-)